MRILVTIIMIIWGLELHADPQCGFNLSVNTANVQLNETIQVIQQGLSLDKTSNSSHCLYYSIYFGKGQANSYQRMAYNSNNQSITYNLYSAINMSGILKDFGDALASNEYLQGQAPSKDSTYTNTFYISVPGLSTQNSPASGTYRDTVPVTLYSSGKNDNSYNFERVANLVVALIVAQKIDISVVDEGGAFDPTATNKVIDFGFIQQNQEKGVDLRVVSNTPYEIKISSSNNSVLKQSQGNSIAYALKVNGGQVSLNNSQSTPVSIGSGSGTGGATGDKYNLRVQITEITVNKAAGTYQDVITITAIAK
jgi:spore coat protein U-like protein